MNCYLDVMVNCCFNSSLLGTIFQTCTTVTVTWGAAWCPGQAGHPVERDGSFCALNSQGTLGSIQGRLATKSLINPLSLSTMSRCTGWIGVFCPSSKANGTLNSDVGHAGYKVPQCRWAMLSKLWVQAEVSLQGQHSLGMVLQRSEWIVVQTAVFCAFQHACQKIKESDSANQ